jgi:hypothetical protein
VPELRSDSLGGAHRHTCVVEVIGNEKKIYASLGAESPCDIARGFGNGQSGQPPLPQSILLFDNR